MIFSTLGNDQTSCDFLTEVEDIAVATSSSVQNYNVGSVCQYVWGFGQSSSCFKLPAAASNSSFPYKGLYQTYAHEPRIVL